MEYDPRMEQDSKRPRSLGDEEGPGMEPDSKRHRPFRDEEDPGMEQDSTRPRRPFPAMEPDSKREGTKRTTHHLTFFSRRLFFNNITRPPFLKLGLDNPIPCNSFKRTKKDQDFLTVSLPTRTCRICAEVRHARETIRCSSCQVDTCNDCTLQGISNGFPAGCMGCPWVIAYSDIPFFFPPSVCKKVQEATTKCVVAKQLDSCATLPFERRVSDEMLAREQDTIAANIRDTIKEMRMALETADTTAIKLRHPESVQPVRGHFCFRPGCNGIFNDQLACSSCHTTFCRDCETPVHPGSACDEASKASIESIKSSCKPCPGCGNYTAHESGCNDVWCRSCNTHFNFRTGKKTGAAHNPDCEEYGGTTFRNQRQPFSPSREEVLRKFDKNEKLPKKERLDRAWWGATRRLINSVYSFYARRPTVSPKDPFGDYLINFKIGTLKGDEVTKEQTSRLLANTFRRKEKAAKELQNREAFLKDASVLLRAYLEPSGDELRLEQSLLERMIFHDVNEDVRGWGFL